VKDFKYYVPDSVWYVGATPEKKQEYFDWALNHPQFNHSTDDINRAEMFYLDQTDLAARLSLESYAPVEYIRVHLTAGPQRTRVDINVFP
jgi:hypothetical protein